MNLNVNIGWTEDRVERAAKLWSDGFSAAAIAERLGGVSRNAVIGKAFRHPDRFPARLGASPRIEKSMMAKPAGVRPEAQKQTIKPAGFRKPAPLPEVPIDVPTRPNGAFRHRDLPIGGAASVPFDKRGNFQCSWPLTDFDDPDTAAMPCCGRQRRGGLAPDSAYCAEHAAISRGAA